MSSRTYGFESRLWYNNQQPEDPENSFSRRESGFPGFLRLRVSVLSDAKQGVPYARDAPPNAPLFGMVTQFILRTDKKDSAGRSPVHLVVYFDGARLVSSGYSYTGERDNPACALQAGLVIRIGLYRQTR